MDEVSEPKKPKKKKGRAFSATCFRGHGWTKLNTVWYTRMVHGVPKKFRQCRLCYNLRHRERYKTDPDLRLKLQTKARARHEAIRRVNADVETILTQAGLADAFQCAEVDPATGGNHGALEGPPQ